MAHSIEARTAPAHNKGQSTASSIKTRKLMIIGATRNTGQYVMQQALASDYDVTVVARDRTRIAAQHNHLIVRQGDVMNQATLLSAMTGQDALVSTIGGTSRAPTTLYSEGMRHIIAAMRAAGVKRLIAVSAAPLGIDAGDTLPSRLLMKPLLLAVFKNVYADMARMEEEIRTSDLDWTIIRPPRLTDKPPTGRYRTALNRRGYTVARADLADAIITLLDDPTAIHATVSIGY